MTVYRTTEEILSDPWKTQVVNTTAPDSQEYCYNWRELSIDDIAVWEEIYSQPGNLGIYAAWSPLSEYYVIIFNLFVNREYGIEKFYGPNAKKNVVKRAAALGVQLQESNSWVDVDHMWMHVEQD
jgi:hypothetical protein